MLDEENLTSAVNGASAMIAEEQSRSRNVSDPGTRQSTLTTCHLEALKRRHMFLKEYSDEILASTPIETLLKLESTSIKLRNLEKGEGTDDKLALNRDNLETTNFSVEAGTDNRWSKLHAARFLPGAGCSAVKLWLRAREILEGSKIPPIAVYDMASIGLAGYVTPKGWATIHDPGNSSLQLRLFSINNCGKRVSSKTTEYEDDNLNDIAELGELKCALRVLREAMAYVHPWNKSIAALEGFLLQNNFCNSDLGGTEKSVATLSQFIDYCLRENSNRWRGQEAFLIDGELKGTWESFYGARPQAMLAKGKKAGPSSQCSNQTTGSQANSRNSNTWTGHNKELFFDDICVLWNIGKCVKPVGSCATKKGRPLRHVCNYRPNMNNMTYYCGANHVACNNH